MHCGTYQVPEVCLPITAAKKSTIPIDYTMNEFNR
jgi:hypothetical protein